MSETIELPKPKRVYKKKVATPISEPVATPIHEPIATHIPEPVATPIPEPIVKEKKPRSQKQIEAFNRMREAKQKKKQECVTPHTTDGGLGVSPNEHIPEPPVLTRLTNEPCVSPHNTDGGLVVSPKKRTYKKKEPQQVYIDARTIHAQNPESYNEPPIYTQQVPQRIQEKTYKPYIFV